MITPSTANPDTLWNSVYREILFGIDDPNYSYPWLYSGVTNVDGKAKFTSSGFNAYGTPPCKLFYCDSGIYAGVHAVVSIDASGNILTSTDYISTASGLDGRCLVNLKYRINYGYGTYPNSVEMQPFWKADGTMVVNIAKILQAVFPSPTPPPVIGQDQNLFTHFQVQIVPAEDFQDFLTANALDAETVISGFTLYDYTNYLWYALNGSIENGDLVANHLGVSDTLNDMEPIAFTNQCIIFSKIVGSVVVNVKYCNGTASQQGVGYWELENDFIIS